MFESKRVVGVSSFAAALLALGIAASAQADTYHVAVSGPHGGGGGGARGGAPGGHVGGGVRVGAPSGIRVGPPGGVRVGYPGVHVGRPYGVRPGYGYPGGVRGRPVVVPRGRIWHRNPYYGYRTYWDPYYYSYGTYGYGWGYESYPYAYYGGAAVVGVAAAPPAAVVVGGRQPQEPTIGVGVRGSTVRAGENHAASEGLGAVMRFRARPVELELEVGFDHFGSDTNRDDTRVGASLYVPLAGTVIQPYLVVGAGMNFAHFDGTDDTLHQGFLAGGGGLALNFSKSFTIAADARYLVREFFDDDDKIAANPITLERGQIEKHDDAVEFRANAIFYF